MKKEGRLFEIDVLRGIAALGVVLFHYTVAFRDQYSHASEIFPVLRYLRYGKHGVAMFFIISGFFILMSLGRTRSTSDFIFSRFSRLYPAYWAALILSFTILTFASLYPFPGVPATWKDAFINLTMLQEFFKVPHIDGSYWTLSLELSFYVIMLTLYKFRFLKRIDSVVIIWLLVISIAYLVEKQAILVDSRVKILLILEHAHLFIIGILLYRIHTQGFLVKRVPTVIGCLLFSLVKYGTETTLFLVLFVVIFSLALRSYLAFINFKPLIFLGTISYSLYLTHVYPGLLIIRTLEAINININVCILIATATSIALATIITFYVEKRIMNFMWNSYRSLKANIKD